MALFTDGSISGSEDLRAYESSILDVASTEGIELEAKLNLAQREIGVQLTVFLLQQSSTNSEMRDLSSIVVTDPLAQWHALHSLEIIYRDAYNSQMNDRYLGKWQEYGKLAKEAASLLYEIGLGFTTDPIGRAAAPDCGVVAGGTLPATTYYIRAAWQSSRGSVGALSEPTPISVEQGMLPTAVAVNAPAGAGGWLVFAGTDPDDCRLQQLNPLPVGWQWTMPASGLDMTLPQVVFSGPEYYVRRRRDLRRS
jgi:hypothetical protein